LKWKNLMIQTLRLMWNRLSEKVRAWIDAALEGTHNHYPCYFPGQTGSLFRMLFSGVAVSREQTDAIRSLSRDAIIVYANKYKSHLEYLFYHSRYREDGLPVPEIGFDLNVFSLQPIRRLFKIILAHADYFFRHFSFPDPYTGGYIREELIKGRVGFLSLVEKGGFYLRFVKDNTDPLFYLIEMQKSVTRPIYIVPHLMFFSKDPHRTKTSLSELIFGSDENPGIFKQLRSLLKKSGEVFAEVSAPLNLQKFVEKPEYQEMSGDKLAPILRRELLVQINRHRQSIIGPILKSPEELNENILTHERLRIYMEHYAQTRKVPQWKVHKEANGYLNEIAAKYRIAMVRLLAGAVKWLTTTMFDGYTLSTEELNKLKVMSRRGPLILVPCHKSHIDYLILSYLLFVHNMPCPHIAAGKNLSFWPMGPIFRGAGAFFIRRTFKGAVLYSKVFAEYVHKLLEEGFNIEFFIEGGRSRTGKLLQPKLGLLSLILNAFKDGACEDLIFAPVFIGYDRVLEESSYLHELEGGQKKPESLSQMISARKFLKKRYGRIYIRFHETFSLNDYMAQTGLHIRDMSPKEQNTLCRSIGYMLLNCIDKVSVITPHAVVAAALLNCSKQRFSYDYFFSEFETYMNYLVFQKMNLADTLLIDPAHAARAAFDSYLQGKLIEKISEQGENASEPLFKVNDNKRVLLEYYKNNCVVAFTPAAFTALAILDRDAFQFSVSGLYETYSFLQNFFKYEFAYDMEKSPEHFVQENIKAFVSDAILMPHPTLQDTYNLTSVGFRKLRLFADFLKAYFESYRIVLNFLMKHSRDEGEIKDKVKKIQELGTKMYKRKEIDRAEALSVINFKNASDFFSSKGVRGSEDAEKIELYMNVIRKYLNHLP